VVGCGVVNSDQRRRPMWGMFFQPDRQ